MISVFTMSKSKDEKNSVTPFAITDYRDIKKRFGIREEAICISLERPEEVKQP